MPTQILGHSRLLLAANRRVHRSVLPWEHAVVAVIIVGVAYATLGLLIARDLFGVRSRWVRAHLRSLESKASPAAWYVRHFGRWLPGVADATLNPARIRSQFRAFGWALVVMGGAVAVLGILPASFVGSVGRWLSWG